MEKPFFVHQLCKNNRPLLKGLRIHSLFIFWTRNMKETIIIPKREWSSDHLEKEGRVSKAAKLFVGGVEKALVMRSQQPLCLFSYQ